MLIVKSNYSEVKETAKGGHMLRLRAETGSSAFIKEYMKANGGAKPAREVSAKHEAWQSLYVYGEAEWLTKLLNKLRHGKGRSLLGRITGSTLSFEAVASVNGEQVKAATASLATGIDFLDVFDADIRRFVPVKSFIK